MRIDSHAHISIFQGNAKNLQEAFALLKKNMEENKIDYAIIIPDNIENSSQIADLEMAQKLIKDSKKFFLLGSPQIVQRGTTELEKYEKLIKDKVIKGIKFFPGHDPYYPIDERCLPYYELCEKYDIPIVIHTGANSGDSECAKWNDPKYIIEVARKYPRLKIVIAHYFWPRLDYCYETTKDIPNIYFDTSAMADEEVIEASGSIEKVKEVLMKTINDNGNKVIFGTDWPMCKIENHLELIKSLNLDKDTEEKIFYKNAIEIYKLPVK